MDDADEFHATVNAMRSLGLTEEEQKAIWKILAGILQLGNISFETMAEAKESSGGGGGGAALDPNASLPSAAGGDAVIRSCTLQHLSHFSSLLSFPSVPSVAKCLLSRMNVIRGERFLVPFDVRQSLDIRDAVAKNVYASLFDWMMARVNESLRNTDTCDDEDSSGAAGGSSPPLTQAPHPHNNAGHTFIGLLDLFGFEDFQHNSLEQFWSVPLQAHAKK